MFRILLMSVKTEATREVLHRKTGEVWAELPAHFPRTTGRSSSMRRCRRRPRQLCRSLWMARGG